MTQTEKLEALQPGTVVYKAYLRWDGPDKPYQIEVGSVKVKSASPQFVKLEERLPAFGSHSTIQRVQLHLSARAALEALHAELKKRVFALREELKTAELREQQSLIALSRTYSEAP